MAAATDWIAIEGLYRSGVGTLRQIADDHGITEGAIRKKAKQLGWLRDPQGAKRERVKAAMAGASTVDAFQYAESTLEKETARDVEDMHAGLRVARQVIRRLDDMMNDTKQKITQPPLLKIIAETNKIAIETIRRIRGLDETGPRDLNKLSDAELEALIKAKAA